MTDTFDFVVVGAGSGGCAVAGRLSEDPQTSVALPRHPQLAALESIEAERETRFLHYAVTG